MKKSKWKEAKTLFNGTGMTVILLLLFFLNFGYFYLTAKDLFLSVVVGIIGAIVLFFSLVVRNQKTKVYQHQLSELLKYASNMVFLLQSDKNVLYSLQESKNTVDPIIQKDIQKTIDILEKEARLDTSHFKKYNFPALDQFHQILQIKYEHGGSAKRMFSEVIKSMNFELTKRDEHYRKNRGMAAQIYTNVGLVGAIPLMMTFIVAHLYDQFLEVRTASSIILLIFYFSFLWNIHTVQKKVNDINIRV
ncbi:hypothetical protein NST12_16405 [Bacillus sp. FSL W8-1127]|uniref:hypothetical protein n=1 Tax=Bacillus sp. FSL W8-1127 TaxID=2954710 RepID=UPI0030F90B29